MKILGIASPFGHDPSAALMIDGKVVAAAEEERFNRIKHSDGEMPVQAINYCLKAGGIKPSEVDIIAYPWSYDILHKKRFEYFFRTFKATPSRALKKFFRNNHEFKNQKNFIASTLEKCGFSQGKVNIKWVEHHIAHAASSFYFSGMEEAAILSIDGGGELTASLMGYARDGKIHKIKEILAPDSLGNFYATMTDYLGFTRGDGEYKVMGMAPYGDASKINMDHIMHWIDRKKTYHCNDDYVWVTRDKRHELGKVYSKKMVDEFGIPREGDALSEPFIHIAAATQKKLEEITLKLVDTYLLKELKRHGNLCFAGGVALNVALNRILLDHPHINNLWVQPSAHDAGASLGAVVYVAAECGDKIEKMDHVYLGPEYNNEEIERALMNSGYKYSKEQDICKAASDLLCEGKIVGWFQGRMEWGPRALGNRSILGNPTIKGIADKINAIIKLRENWRPFCPSILNGYGREILGTDHEASFMTIAFKATEEWKDRIPEVVHVDGTCRPQLVDEKTNPRYHKLISYFHERTGVPVVINTSLNRRGEPMICSPEDALLMFKESGLDYLAMGDFLITK
ncbi:MAG: carbamoyltransferase [Candidatus Omnitrophica bacterium]|nr:carbamoyltransferase [Candidatus Omnitrophota bacterium]MBU1996212.1 carbamoyltransferase [Candidatus Omnitrophota bacterium]MBU4333606.1 carbamoyltransferase [Candidatus Omnitrophota bacterium]